VTVSIAPFSVFLPPKSLANPLKNPPFLDVWLSPVEDSVFSYFDVSIVESLDLFVLLPRKSSDNFINVALLFLSILLLDPSLDLDTFSLCARYL
jgi:hypothetical protein